MVETKQAAVNNLNIQYYCAGAGDTTIVLLHGAGADSAMLSWREVLALLAGEGYPVHFNWLNQSSLSGV